MFGDRRLIDKTTRNLQLIKTMTQMERAMQVRTVGEIIAMRELYYFDETDQKKRVSVIVGKPQPLPNSSEFQCHFQLIGIGNPALHTARGYDSLQALQSALTSAGTNVKHLSVKLGRGLIWDGSAKGELGFPGP